MPKRTTRLTHGDEPVSAAKHPNPVGAGLPVDPDDAGALIGRTVTINKPRQELYEFWRDFRNLPLFMDNIESVRLVDARRSHWKVKAPAGTSVEWDSLLTEDLPGEVIAWKSAENSSVDNSGRIEFRDSGNGRGTRVTVTIAYDPPAGGFGKLVAKLFQREPNIQARRDLRRFKQLMETGEIPTSEPPLAAPRGD
jgi:uncharacterized membrane protein